MSCATSWTSGLILRRTRALLLMGVLCASCGAAQDSAPSAGQDSNVFASAMRSFVAAQQEALTSADPDRILQSSSAVAVGSLALLNNLDARDQQARNASGALPWAQEMVSDLPTELMLLRMELSLGESADAAKLKAHILSTNPESANLHATLSTIFEQGWQFDDGAREAQRAVELDPGARDAQIALGLSYWGLNAFHYNEETLRAFTAAHQIDPDSYSTNLLLGTIESQYQRFDDASVHLHAATNAEPAAPEPWYQLGMNAWEQARRSEAGNLLQHYLSLAEAGRNARPSQVRVALLTLDDIAEEDGQAPDGAHRAEEDALKQQLLASDSAAANAGALAMGSSDAGDRAPVPEKGHPAGATAETLQQLRELAASSLGNIGAVLARRNDYAKAIVPLRYAADEDPSLDTVMRNLGFAACMTGSFEEGARALKQVVTAHPDDPMARGYLGYAEFETGDYSDAAGVFSSLGAALPSHPLFEATAAATFARAGDRARAEQALAPLQSAEANPQVQAREAVAHLDLGNTDHAAALAQAALKGGAAPAAEALRVLGLLDLERGDAARAASEFQDELKAESPDAGETLEVQALLARALMQSGRAAEGRELTLKLVHANPNLAADLARQGRILRRNADQHAAWEKFAAALTLAPHDAEIRAAFDSTSRSLHLPNR